jgi:hypothetical protein
MEEMRDVAEEAKPLDGTALKRAQAALSHLGAPAPFDAAAASARVAELLGAVA